MKAVLRAAGLLLCLGFALGVHPAAARADDFSQDLYDATRARYLAEQAGVTSTNMDIRRSAYLGQIKNAPGFWWSVWKKHQPYSDGVDYHFRTVETEIPTDPGHANNSAYGQNVIQLIYGNKDASAGGRTAAEAAAPIMEGASDSNSILAGEATYGSGNANDANASINTATYPTQSITPRDATPVQDTDVQQMLPQH